MCKHQRDCSNPVLGADDKCTINPLSCYDAREMTRKARAVKAFGQSVLVVM